MQRRRPSRRDGARPVAAAVVRALAVLLLVAFGWSVSLAYVSPCSHVAHTSPPAAEGSPRGAGDGCCPGEAGEAKGRVSPADADDHGDDGHCSCPIDCGPCCQGAGVLAVAPEVPGPSVAFVLLTELRDLECATRRADHEPRDILHVPRTA